MSVSPIAPIHLPQVAPVEGATTKVEPGTDLGGAFSKALTEARELETTATDAAERFANGDKSIGIHEVMIASEKANIAVRYATTLKNKAIEAYRELMNTQV